MNIHTFAAIINTLVWIDVEESIYTASLILTYPTKSRDLEKSKEMVYTLRRNVVSHSRSTAESYAE